MDAADRDLFAAAVRRATEAHTGTALDAALDEVGWHDALGAEPRVAVSLSFECQGACNATSSALGSVVRAGLGVGPRSAEGPAVVLPALGRWDPPGTLAERLSIRGLGMAALPMAEHIVVPVRGGAGDLVVPVPRGRLTLAHVQGLDPALGLVTVEVDGAHVGSGGVLATGTWAAAVDLARLAVGHELVGAAGAMLELARVHALEREQFGRPIAAFQAVRHRLADTLVAIEGARALLDAAWDDGSSDTAAMAKAMAGRAARVAARHCQQVLAGIGFTTEHPLHRYVRRVLVLDELFGSARALTRVVGNALVVGGPLPAPVPL